jgi:AMMECR1 domain-containing protein
MLTDIITNILTNKNIVSLKDKIPSDVFGVFVTVKRSKEQQIKSFPYDIHGCMGRYNKDFSNLSNIREVAMEVGRTAFYNDDRRKYFVPDIDMNTEFELTYMLSPPIQITPTNDQYIFDNNKYGLLVIQGYKTATYLPHVFYHPRWTDISSSLKQKAGIVSGDATFYAYNTVLLTKKLGEYFNKINILMKQIKKKFKKFITDNYFTYIPYMVKNNKLIIQTLQHVRNLATTYDVLHVLPNANMELTKRIKKSLFHYIDMLPISNQSDIFLALCLYKLGIRMNIVTDIINRLYGEMEQMKLEPMFELGEVMMGLAIMDPRPIILDKVLDRVKLTVELDGIFQLNWMIKALQIYNPNHILVQKIQDNLISILPQITDMMETNYIAVTFECTSCMLLCRWNQYIRDYINQLIIILLSRYNPNYGLFEFQDGTMRVDITGHVLNGIYYMNLVQRNLEEIMNF